MAVDRQLDGVARARRRSDRERAARDGDERLGGILIGRKGIRDRAHRVSCACWYKGNLASADSTADEAVWPRPQIEASRITWPSSWRSATSCSREPSGR